MCIVCKVFEAEATGLGGRSLAELPAVKGGIDWEQVTQKGTSAEMSSFYVVKLQSVCVCVNPCAKGFTANFYLFHSRGTSEMIWDSSKH